MKKAKTKKINKIKRVKQNNFYLPEIRESIERVEDYTEKVKKKFKVSRVRAKELVSKSANYNIEDETDMMYVIKNYLLKK